MSGTHLRAAGAWPAAGAGASPASAAPPGFGSHQPGQRPDADALQPLPRRWPAASPAADFTSSSPSRRALPSALSAASRRSGANLPTAAIARARTSFGASATDAPSARAPSRRTSSRSRGESSSISGRHRRASGDVRDLRRGEHQPAQLRRHLGRDGQRDRRRPARLALAQQLAGGLAQRRRGSQPPGSVPVRSAPARSSVSASCGGTAPRRPETAPPDPGRAAPAWSALRSRGRVDSTCSAAPQRSATCGTSWAGASAPRPSSAAPRTNPRSGRVSSSRETSGAVGTSARA